MASDMGCDGYNLFMANGGAAGQEVFHATSTSFPGITATVRIRLPSALSHRSGPRVLDAQATLFKNLLEAPTPHQEEL
jgi:hypothetical protein